MAPSTFASAAAGNPSRDAAANDWNRRTNGATQTFRRPSGATTSSTAAQPLDPLPASQPARYVPPHRNGTLPDTRYSKEQLLDLYKSQHNVDGGLSDGLTDLFVAGYQPEVMNGASSGWARTEHNRDPQPGSDICWDRDGVEPMGLVEMDDEERELFTNSVNTPIKPVSTSKENQQPNGLPGRKISVSNVTTPGGYGLPSPNVARGNGRRRETSESFPFPQNNVSSPGGYTRDEQRTASPPPSLLRRRTDFKDLGKDDKDADEKSTSSPYGTLKRHQTGPMSAGFNAPSSPWSSGPQSAGVTPMGSFGNFGGSTQAGAPGEKRPGLGSGRSESRFKSLLSKDSSEDVSQRPAERKGSISGLGRVNEHESWRVQDRADHGTQPLDEADEDIPTGSAALAADVDISASHHRQGFRGFGTPSRQGTQQDDFGFSAFGMTSDNTHAFGQAFPPGRDAFHQTPAFQRVGQQSGTGNEPMSPTDTNPYQSPEQHGTDRAAEENGDGNVEAHNAHLPGLGQFANDPSQQLGGLGSLGALPNLGRGAQGPASDRSQTSSVGPARGFPGLASLGQFGAAPGSTAWPVPQGTMGTPSRQTAGLSNPFGAGVFSNPLSDLQSPGLAGLGGGSLMSPPGSTFGGSRMASMFPPAIQDQMRQGDHDHDGAKDRSPHGFAGLGDLGRSGDTAFASQGFGQGQESTDGSEHQQFGASGQQAQSHEPSQAQSGSSASNQPPAPQQRTMVMPDRMRWIYRDPQGQTQGPWTGLEMHDWYKAGFFSPELLVKKFEDPDYEPLAQLIRRIGNSREPFLVPQIGIPHGQPTSTGTPSAWSGTAAVGNTGAQPPFASSFPSFGTTLTAEQQNALERRKQEEQYLMARQKEHLAQAQIAQRQMMQGSHSSLSANQLHHHSSAHSLQSQPSYSSITSPSAYQPSPIQGPTGGIIGAPPLPFDSSFRSPQQGGLGAVGAGADLHRIREEEIPNMMDRLNLGGVRSGADQFGAPGERIAHERQVQQMLDDRARLEQEQAQHDARQQEQEVQRHIPNERLQQFQQLQAEHEDLSSVEYEETLVPQVVQESRRQEPLSLTEQVQKAASAKQSPAPQQIGLPQPFPPAPSQSPLPAPAARRADRQSFADQLQTDSRDHSQTPSVDTPSAAVAPWAKEPVEASKGPSLKEIQEAEAKQAAQAELIAAAARRAALEKELQVSAQAAAPQPGLPTSSTWGAPSPATPTGSVPAAWAKTAQKPAGPSSSKTLAQIQKEEEARKKKHAAAVAAAQSQAAAISAVSAPSIGKSYANLAGKVAAPSPTTNMGSGAWTTVGAGGKTKTPTTGPPPTTSRAVSAGVVPTLQPATTVRKPAVRSAALAGANVVSAQEEFRKWAVNELRPDLSKGINAEEFVATLIVFPPEIDMITEAVHGVSNTIDSRHFAEEFVKRKAKADKGVIEPKSTSSPSHAAEKNGGGWSQVAKKGPVKEEPAAETANGNFRVVPSKKKGGKR